MKKNIVSVLDFGSSKISMMMGSFGLNNSFIIYGKSECDYSGFSDAEFFEAEKLEGVIGTTIEDIEMSTRSAVKVLTIGVPAEFCICKTNKVNATFMKKRKLTDDLIDEIQSSAIEKIEGYTLVSLNSIYNVLDDGNKHIEIKNLKTSKITSFVSAVYIKTDFIALVNNILKKLGILKVTYVSSELCKALYLTEQNLHNNVAIIDIGYLTTSIAVSQGGGLLGLYSFSLGGAHIMADLAECLQIGFREAENLKREIVLSILPSPNDFYEIKTAGGVKKFYKKLAGEIFTSRLDMICSYITACLKKLPQDMPTSIYLTGGGVCYVKGAKDYISKKLGVNIDLISPPVPQFCKPHLSSLISLLNFALKNQTKNSGLLAKRKYI